MAVKFKVEPYWSNVDPADPFEGWGWVYLLSTGSGDDVTYVGIAKNLSRRLSEHARFWLVDRDAYALAIPAWTERDARLLEAAFICLLDPPGNSARPKLSWVERRHFDRYRDRWYGEIVRLCEGCSTLIDYGSGGITPIIEPLDPDCYFHDGPARTRLAEGALLALYHSFAGTQWPEPSLGSLFSGLGLRAFLPGQP